jgi:hypothetical protein
VKLIPETVLQDAPALSNAQVAIDRRSSPPAIVVSTPAPVLEPAVRFVLELGCSNRLRREFVLLIDPPDLPAVQTAAAPIAVPPAARVLPREESRWGATAAAPSMQSADAQPMFDAPLAEPPKPAVPARKATPKPKLRPKPAARLQVAQAKPAPALPASAPPPPMRAPEAAKPSGTDRLVLSDTDPAAAKAAEQAAKDTATAEKAAKDAAREEALTRQIEALTKEVARMREDMDKLAARNRELAKEAENSRTGWFAAAGLGIALAGVGLGLLGRRERKPTWRDNLAAGDGEIEPSSSTTFRAPLPDVREEPVPPFKPAVAAVGAAAAAQSFSTTTHDITDLDITKIDVQEDHGPSSLINPGPATTAGAVTTMFPSDLSATTELAESVKSKLGGPLQELDFSLDDIDLKVPTLSKHSSPVFSPSTQVSPEESEAARAKLFEEIEQVHRASKKS